MTVVFTYIDSDPPYPPQIVQAPVDCTADADDLQVQVTGPDPADPDGDSVTYEYRWFVDVGNGYYLDDEFAGRGDHAGPVVPAADTVTGDLWKVVVTPIDQYGLHGPVAEAY
jgi:hypothetical protein